MSFFRARAGRSWALAAALALATSAAPAALADGVHHDGAIAKGPKGKKKGGSKAGKSKGSEKGASKDASALRSAPHGDSGAPSSSTKPPKFVDAPLAELADPAIVSDRTDAGLSVSVVARPDMGSAAVVLRLPFGSAVDPDAQGGLVTIAARAVSRSAPVEREAFRAEGGIERVDVTPDAVTFVLRAPAADVGAALSLLETQLGATISADDVTKARSDVSGVSFEDDARAMTLALAYQGYAPYEHRARGSDAYLAKVPPEAVEQLRRARFVPTGATLTVVGPVDPATIVTSAKTAFGGKPAPEAAGPSGQLAEQTNQRASDMQETGAPTALHYAWALPGASADDLERLAILGRLAGDVRISDALASAGIPSRVHAALDVRKGPSVFTLDVTLPIDADIGKAKKSIDDALADLGKKAANPEDFGRARHATWLSHEAELDDPVALGVRIASGARTFASERQLLDGSRPEDLVPLASKYLGPLTRSLVETRDPARPKPRSTGGGGGAEPPPAHKAEGPSGEAGKKGEKAEKSDKSEKGEHHKKGKKK